MDHILSTPAVNTGNWRAYHAPIETKIIPNLMIEHRVKPGNRSSISGSS